MLCDFIENDFDNDGKSDMGNDGYTSESEMRKCEVCDKCIRNSTYASHLLWCLKRFGRENTTKNVQKSRRDPCCVCKQDLHGMTLQEKAHHVNW